MSDNSSKSQLKRNVTLRYPGNCMYDSIQYALDSAELTPNIFVMSSLKISLQWQNVSLHIWVSLGRGILIPAQPELDLFGCGP